jgi:uncharacterized protein VirK/YbjX
MLTNNETATCPRLRFQGGCSPFSRRRRHLLIRALCLCWRLVANAIRTGCVLRVLLAPVYVEVWSHDARFPVKWLFRDYLAKGLSVQQSVASFVHHYKRLREMLPDSVVRELLKGDIVLQQLVREGHYVTLAVGKSKLEKEGELSLVVKVDDVVVSTLSFTIIPGWVVGLETSESLLISRLQGAAMDCYSREIGLATKAWRGVGLRWLLLSALEGIAMGMEIDNIAGVTSRRQISFREECAQAFGDSYDSFFISLGMKVTKPDFYSANIPLGEKALGDVKGRHRTRAKRRRAMKDQIRSVCAVAFSRGSLQQGASNALGQPYSPVGAMPIVPGPTGRAGDLPPKSVQVIL